MFGKHARKVLMRQPEVIAEIHSEQNYTYILAIYLLFQAGSAMKGFSRLACLENVYP
jgi:hypothetical protein